jgi:ankyrin repeat protein
MMSLLVQQDLETTIHLLKSGVVDVLQTDPKGANVLHLACRSGNLELVSVLLYFDDSEGTLINSHGENGWTALHEAISLKRLDVFRLLVKRGARTDEMNAFGETPRVLGLKIGIETADIESVWFASNKVGSSQHPDATATVMAGAMDALNIDPRLLKLLAAPEGGSSKRSSKALGTDLPLILPMSRLQTYDGVPTDRKPSIDDLFEQNKSGDSSQSSSSTNLQAPPPPNKQNPVLLKLSFTKMFGSKSKRRDATIEEDSPGSPSSTAPNMPSMITVTGPSPPAASTSNDTNSTIQQ